MENYFQQYLASLGKSMEGLLVTDAGGHTTSPDEGFQRLCDLSRAVGDRGFRQFLCGNGASAAFSNHMALDWTKNGGVPTFSFSDSALLTAMGNDLGYEEVFSAPLSWYAHSGDLLVTISSSGNSPNIIKVIQAARTKGMGVVTLSGLHKDNQSRRLGDLNFFIEAKTYGIVECAHQVLLHIWLDRFMGIREWEKTRPQDMRKDRLEI
jgi:D-sedoheptulose 7-phosphate isomerase